MSLKTEKVRENWEKVHENWEKVQENWEKIIKNFQHIYTFIVLKNKTSIIIRSTLKEKNVKLL
jgi:hypothetical protein